MARDMREEMLEAAQAADQAAASKPLGEQLRILQSRNEKLRVLQTQNVPVTGDFIQARRRHVWCVEAMQSALASGFTGSEPVFLAISEAASAAVAIMKHEMEVVGG